jgi:hypothetical protein
MFNVWKIINAYSEYASSVHHAVRDEHKKNYEKNDGTAIIM